MNQAFAEYLAACRQRADLALDRFSKQIHSEYSGHKDDSLSRRLYEAMRYSLLNGGKRVRPTLVYASAEALDPGCSELALDHIAASVECLHSYSLVHDDLPAMDDDDLRRGQPTCHRAYDEATAILAGDALHTLAFELLADCPGLESSQRISLVKALAAASGARGMVGGQFIDLSLEHHQPAIELLQTMHSLKTGALIRAALRMGGIAANANGEQLQALDRYGNFIGLAFQVKDDLLDIEGSTEVLGKQQGSDINNSKMTYPGLLGQGGSRDLLEQLLQEALMAVAVFGDKAERLRQLGGYIISRNY